MQLGQKVAPSSMEFISEVLENYDRQKWEQIDAKGLRDGEQFLENGVDVLGL
jgi:hypothetical protein